MGVGRDLTADTDHRDERHFDVAIVGSGFGGSVAAHRLSEKGYRVAVLEAGRRWNATDFPNTNWNVWKSMWFPRLGMKGIQRLTMLKHVMALSGVGVGGGSLVYANTHYEPKAAFYTDPQWATVADWKAELAPCYAEAKRMLGVTTNPLDTPADDVLRTVAAELGVEDTFEPTPVAVYFGGSDDVTVDPYFGGEGPERSPCVGCGNCMVGCRYSAKNTLDKNYLWFAERAGARVFPEHEVVDLEELRDGWIVTTRRPGPRRTTRTFFARQVVLSAGTLGTTRLLLELSERGRLPHLSPRVGYQTRTNSEAIVGAVAADTTIDYSKGVAITSSIHPDEHTQIEVVRYGKGSNALGLLGTILVDGATGVPRQIQFLKQLVRHPLRFLRSLSVWRWSERTVVLLVMQTHDNSLRLLRKRGLFGRRLTSQQGHGNPNPTYIPVANRAARIAARAMGGQPAGSVHEVLFDAPTTAHLLGGAAIGPDASTGVVDGYHRVYGHPTLHVVDGSAIGANPGVNPSLTITAMAERAMSHWPVKGQPDLRPPPPPSSV